MCRPYTDGRDRFNTIMDQPSDIFSDQYSDSFTLISNVLDMVTRNHPEMFFKKLLNSTELLGGYLCTVLLSFSHTESRINNLSEV